MLNTSIWFTELLQFRHVVLRILFFVLARRIFILTFLRPVWLHLVLSMVVLRSWVRLGCVRGVYVLIRLLQGFLVTFVTFVRFYLLLASVRFFVILNIVCIIHPVNYSRAHAYWTIISFAHLLVTTVSLWGNNSITTITHITIPTALLGIFVTTWRFLLLKSVKKLVFCQGVTALFDTWAKRHQAISLGVMDITGIRLLITTYLLSH